MHVIQLFMGTAEFHGTAFAHKRRYPHTIISLSPVNEDVHRHTLPRRRSLQFRGY